MRADAERGQVARRRRRTPQVGDVALVPVEGAVERERAAVETDTQSSEPASAGRQPLALRGAGQADRQQIARPPCAPP